jgi:transcriptional regulator with XRE-family HTH domain
VYFLHSARVATSPQRNFGQRVRELRRAAGLTQEDLADRCGLFRTYMSRVETGQANPTLSMIHALAASLGVPVAALFPETAEAPPKARRAARPSRGRVAR